jgi:hypothetical protein
VRKELLILLLLAWGPASNAQVLIAILFGKALNTDKLEFGLLVGGTLMNVTNCSSDFRTGLDLGMYFNLKLSKDFFFHPEIVVKSNYGGKGIPVYPTGNTSLDSLYKGGSVQRNIHCFSMPIMARYRIYKLFFLDLGPQVDLIWQTHDDLKNKVNGHDLDYTISNRERYNWFAFGLVGGVEYKFKKDKGMGLGVRYCLGLTDMMRSDAGNQAYRLWMAHLDIPIGSGGSNKTKTKTGQ